jgi:membrane protein DedA with SNARE-associated domain
MVRMPWWRFFVYNALGAILWVGVFSLGAYYLGENMDQILPVLKRFKYYVVTIGLLVLVPTIIYVLKRKPRETPREDP